MSNLGTCEMDGADEHHDDGHEIYWHCEEPAVVTMRVSRPCGDPYEMRVCEAHEEELLDAGAEVVPRAGEVMLASDDGSRRAVVYPVAGMSGLWRIRAEMYPGHSEPGSGWFGGRVLWGYDRTSEAAAVEVARRWTDEGLLPLLAKPYAARRTGSAPRA